MFANGTGGTGSGAAGNPPPETPADSAEQDGARRPARDVQDGQDTTRSEIVENINPLKAPDVENKVEVVLKKMENIHKRMQYVDSIAKKYFSGPKLKEWEDTKEYLALKIDDAQLMHVWASTLSKWHLGDLPPRELYKFLINSGAMKNTPTIRKEENREAIQDQLVQAISRGVQNTHNTDTPYGSDSDADWKTRNAASRYTVVRSIYDEKLPPGEDGKEQTVEQALSVILKDINDEVQMWENAINASNVESFIADFEKETSETKSGESTGLLEAIKNVPSSMGMKFYSIEEIILAGKSVIDAYKESYRQKQQLNAATLSKQMGKMIKFLPWAGDVQQILDKELDSKNDEIKSKYADYLKSRNASYDELFDPKGELMRNRNDGNRARGVLEYAAHRGWLYDIDLGTKAQDAHNGFTLTDGTIISFWNLVPKDWDDTRTKDEYSKFITAQNSGKREESEKYYNRYYNVNKAKDFVDLVHEELKKHNLWAVQGIIKRSIERGLAGEVASWHAVTIMQYLEQDPVTRRIATQDWYDQIGNLSFYRTSFTLGEYKWDRDSLMEWRKRNLANTGTVDISDAGVLGNIVSRVRRDILNRSGQSFNPENPDDQKKLNQYIAQVLSAQVTKVGSEQFSIFDDRYNDYRTGDVIRGQGATHPGVKEEDPDYFTHIADNHLAGDVPVAEILERTGQGEFRHKDKAMNYVGNIIMSYRKHRHEGFVAPAENLRKEMGHKITKWMWESTLGDSRAPGLDKMLIKGKHEMAGRPALNSLITEGFIDIAPIIIAYERGAGGKALAGQLLQNDNPELFRQLKELTDNKPKDYSEEQEKLNRIIDAWHDTLPKINFTIQYESKPRGVRD
jgi:hypothetical protein